MVKPRISVALLTICLLLAYVDFASGQSSERIEFPTYGISFVTPASARELIATGPNIVATWEKQVASDSDSHLKIAVEMSPSRGKSLEDYVKSKAGKMNLAIDSEGVRLGDEPAMKIHGAVPSHRYKHLTSVIGKRHEQFYLVTCVADSLEIAKSEIESTCSSWKWSAPEPPAAHLDLAGGAQLFDRKLSIRYPRLMRPHPSTQPGRDFAVALLNIMSDVMQEFSIQVTPIPKNPEITLKQLCDNFGMVIQQKLATEELSWKKQTDQEIYLSSLTSAKLAPGNGRPMNSYLRYALIELSDFNVLIQFTVMTSSQRDLAKYDSLIEKVADSITTPK